MKALSWLREAFHEAFHPEPQLCPHQLEALRLRSQLARVTTERNEAREALAEVNQQAREALADLHRKLEEAS